ncbi:adenylate/guanylate cyclase domain-containing protein [Variovorax sp. Sphag1AA]|uniref:adenylate/guanylate cyclase domain-containing protein n=1 Tax=Variovorax sp. Sphag1AA TaxID=2587027 RepID=UPI0016198924|nr:adenylate/guanylate cyclase domain-containing protein [Variovorax sp. Sphag1AA]MBB3181300.1 hypothetical protein [Variovorax sp. Sphag1AA]
MGTFARIAWAPDYTFGTPPEVYDALLQRMEQEWGKGVLLSALAPSLADDAAAREWWGRFQRQSCSPGAAVALLRMAYEIDARPILPAIRVPAMILHRVGERTVPVEHARYLAQRIPGAEYAEFPGGDHFRGREVDTAGDGFFAAFDGPARAVRCAAAIGSSVRSLGLEIRAGVHTGECEVMGAKIGGIAVHIGARIASAASPGEILVSSTVKDLVAGSGLAFQDRGSHELKGVPGQWRLYAASEAS